MKASAKLALRLVIKQKPLIGHVPQMHDTDLTASAPTQPAPTRTAKGFAFRCGRGGQERFCALSPLQERTGVREAAACTTFSKNSP